MIARFVAESNKISDVDYSCRQPLADGDRQALPSDFSWSEGPAAQSPANSLSESNPVRRSWPAPRSRSVLSGRALVE